MTPEVENRIVLPTKSPHVAPNREDGQWFESNDFRENSEFDSNCMKALVSAGIGERTCPTPSEWVAFSFVGAIVATLTGKYLVAPESGHPLWHRSSERILWEILWENVEEHKDTLDKNFLASTLRSFLPRSHRSPPDRPYYKSRFESRWRGPFGDGWADTTTQSVGNLRISCLKDGKEALLLLPESVQDSIQKVATHVPHMLVVAMERMRKTYQW